MKGVDAGRSSRRARPTVASDAGIASDDGDDPVTPTRPPRTAYSHATPERWRGSPTPGSAGSAPTRCSPATGSIPTVCRRSRAQVEVDATDDRPRRTRARRDVAARWRADRPLGVDSAVGYAADETRAASGRARSTGSVAAQEGPTSPTVTGPASPANERLQQHDPPARPPDGRNRRWIPLSPLRAVVGRRRRRCRGRSSPAACGRLQTMKAATSQGRPDRGRGSRPAEGPDPRGEGREAPHAARGRGRGTRAPRRAVRTSRAASSSATSSSTSAATCSNSATASSSTASASSTRRARTSPEPTANRSPPSSAWRHVRRGRQHHPSRGRPRGGRARRGQARPGDRAARPRGSIRPWLRRRIEEA